MGGRDAMVCPGLGGAGREEPLSRCPGEGLLDPLAETARAPRRRPYVSSVSFPSFVSPASSFGLLDFFGEPRFFGGFFASRLIWR